ncbi:hypothetical protein D3C77_508560 [compost metagenome]
MASEMDSVNEKPESAPFNTERLRNLVLDHVLDNPLIFLGDGPGAVEKLTSMMDSLTALAEKVALEAIANRMKLESLPTFGSMIHADPHHDLHDDKLYEMRYRMVEQIGNEKPYKDEVMTKAELREAYGDEFLEQYWGGMGERCPNSATAGDRTTWFSVVRYPLADQALTQSNQVSEKRGYRAPSLG